MEVKFIAFDWCGFAELYGRFTAMPTGDTLVCRQWMGQREWDAAQLAWFEHYNPAVAVYRCLDGPYRETDDSMGTVGEIIERLKAKVPL
jgi:hypothetical protein